MVPNIERGTSFKGVTAYLMHDKRDDGARVSSERVGFTRLFNFRDGSARDPFDAAKLMAQTVRDADHLKIISGVRPGGRKATKPPVWHGSLAWHPSEQVDETEMLRAVEGCLAAVGLGLDQGLQTYVVQHTDEPQPHIHVVVNLVHPVTGKQVNPYRDLPAAQAWGLAYERERGPVFCKARALKYGLPVPAPAPAAQERDTAPRKPDRFGRSRERKPRPLRVTPPVQLQPDFQAAARTVADRKRPALPDAAGIIAALTAQHSTFTRRDLARYVWTRCADAAQLRAVIAQVEAAPLLVRLGKDASGQDRFTARDLRDIERQMAADALILHTQAGHEVADRHVTRALSMAAKATGFPLGEEQRAAIAHIVSRGALAAVTGYAGSGKSTMLGAARLAWSAAGYTVSGAALSGIAADGLQQGAGIDSQTIHRRLKEWDRGRNRLTRRDVLVVDEAGMIGSRLMGRLLAHVRAAGAKIVLVGDAEQLQAIDAGAAFRAIAERTGAAKITAIRRQRDRWQQAASLEFATARTAHALDRYAEAGMVHRHRTADDARGALVAAWNEARSSGRSQIMLAYTRRDVRDLNERARSFCRAAGDLGQDSIFQTHQGERRFAPGDRICFLKNDRVLGVRNGTLGTIESADGDRLAVRADDGRRIVFRIADYAHVDHGYAATVHKSQGVTVDRAHVLATRHMDRHAAYVGLTRHRERVDVHYAATDFADSADLSCALSRQRAKDTSLDYEEKTALPLRNFFAMSGCETLASTHDRYGGSHERVDAGVGCGLGR